jgi:hypothetical protein
MPIAPVDVKPLNAAHMDDARLFADRYDLMRHVQRLQQSCGLRNPSVLEIGVAVGDFSAFLIELFRPRHFAAADLFDLHEHEVVWGIPTVEMFKGQTHLDFYRQRMESLYTGDLRIEQGLSAEASDRLADDGYDIVYIDAGHYYENVREDAQVALKKVRIGGFIVFNDYLMMDHLYGTHYGVVQAANEVICDTGRVKVVGLGLNPQMFCDLAVRVVA